MEEILLKLGILAWLIASWLLLTMDDFIDRTNDDLEDLGKRIDQLEEEIKSIDKECKSDG